ncbi:short-subunit dehydrogenase [Ulvibacter sp. MAR_2010_11]|uniref:SDR family NAD(P)-dependent oxidoreductase n=1 Tax=Ulvibacter sp. MAR_2010_11 TaxID=1250229 RepID=UPI000C2CCFA4|nr:SDR family oxidoreductase [Ulvibacter sp. MAR_2010_11]PKA83426.1 short-subunit dehydrogenase [Ulvibacter sp. MAR_2010_11]
MKNIIITGTSRGIGFQLVKLFSSAGYNVLALSRNAKPITDLKLQNCTAISCDLTKSDDIAKVSEFIKANWDEVAILINNSGYLVNKSFSEIKLEDFKQSYNVNVFGVVSIIQVVLPFMKQDGHVVNISSMGGIQGSLKFPGLSAYSSSKGALIALTELLAEEYKETGPAFNVLALGAVQTEMLQEAFPGYKAPVTASEMAAYIYDFSLNGNNFYNGKILQVSSSTP